MTTSLKTRTFRNIGYNAAAQCAMLIMQALANIVLARELASDDYGIIGFSMIFINFLGQFSDFGLNSAVIQEKKFDDKALYTGFTIKAILGLVACAASLACAPLAEMIFDNRAVVAVIQLLSLNLLINSMSFLPLSLLTRELNYKKIAASQILSTLANAFVSIVLALGGYKYWSIVGGTLGTTIVTAIMMNSLKPVKIRFSLDRAKAREYLRFGGNLFLSGLLVFFVFNADNLIIGTTKGAQTLGYYSLAFTWGAMISVLMGAVITGVLFPTFSRIQEDRERIKKGYLQILEVIAFLGAMANISLYVAAPEFLYFLLGNGSDKWMPALATFRIFCFYGIIRVVLEPVGAVIMALGNTRLFVRATGLVAVLEGAIPLSGGDDVWHRGRCRTRNG